MIIIIIIPRGAAPGPGGRRASTGRARLPRDYIRHMISYYAMLYHINIAYHIVLYCIICVVCIIRVCCTITSYCIACDSMMSYYTVLLGLRRPCGRSGSGPVVKIITIVVIALVIIVLLI